MEVLRRQSLSLDEGTFDGTNPPGAIGFWTVFDDIATEDYLGKASRGEPTPSLLSTNMVLRADGQTSRGSRRNFSRTAA